MTDENYFFLPSPNNVIPQRNKLAYQPGDRRDIAAASVIVAQELAAGHNVLIRDPYHPNPDHERLISDPTSLAMYAKSTRSVLLEKDPESAEKLRELQRQATPAAGIMDELAAKGEVTAFSYQAGRSLDNLANTTNLVLAARHLGMQIHGLDKGLAADNPDALWRALAKLSPQDRRLWEVRDPKGMDTAKLPADTFDWDTMHPDGIRIGKLIDESLRNDRIAREPTEAAPNDLAIAKEISARTKDPVVGQYGSGHDSSFRGLSANLTEATGRPTVTIQRYDPASQALAVERASLERRHVLKPPTYIYQPDPSGQNPGVVRRLHSDVLTKACAVSTDWVTDRCSDVVAVDVPPGDLMVQTPLNASADRAKSSSQTRKQ